MAKRSAALLGPGKGPKVHVGNHGRFTIRGLKDGESAELRTYGVDRQRIYVDTDGDYPFPECKFAQVKYEGKNKSFIACVMIGD